MGRRDVGVLHLENADTMAALGLRLDVPAVAVAELRLLPVALLHRLGTDNILVDAPFASYPLQDLVSPPGEVPGDLLLVGRQPEALREIASRQPLPLGVD